MQPLYVCTLKGISNFGFQIARHSFLWSFFCEKQVLCGQYDQRWQTTKSQEL
jgi:hypothetical protein